MASIRSGIGENMEDKYLFKGKRIDNGEWVQGALFNGESHCIIGQEIKFSPYTEHECKIVGYEVDRDTICQCTGLKDKNGKLIWENDIMVAHLDKDNPDDITYAIVAWRENGWVTIENGSDDLNTIDDFTMENFEVVITRFDNPELLESEE